VRSLCPRISSNECPCGQFILKQKTIIIIITFVSIIRRHHLARAVCWYRSFSALFLCRSVGLCACVFLSSELDASWSSGSGGSKYVHLCSVCGGADLSAGRGILGANNRYGAASCKFITKEEFVMLLCKNV